MSILFLGTSSGAGKTTVCAMMCRYLKRSGIDVAPFKGSNLSLNSIATKDGGEIGIGQAFQAWAAGIEPETDMNPVLLKPSGRGVIQLVLNGKPYMDLTKEKKMDHDLVISEMKKAYDRMNERHQLVLCEGSGSPVELNLMKTDVANTGLMRATGVPAILVGDIERGGVFAALYGTWKLIPDELKPIANYRAIVYSNSRPLYLIMKSFSISIGTTQKQSNIFSDVYGFVSEQDGMKAEILALLSLIADLPEDRLRPYPAGLIE